MNEIGKKIFRNKYAIDENETWEDASLRVASYIASNEEDMEEWTEKFFQLIHERVFLPGGRILANAGTGIKNLMNCFALPIGDSREEIYDTLGNVATIFTRGGGVGYNFSSLRERGSRVNSTGGQASGPVSFMELFDNTGDVIQQSSRRGAQMGILNVDHPDILEFINHKSYLNTKSMKIFTEFSTSLDKGMCEEQMSNLYKVLSDNQLTHFNISVGITDAFMKAVKNDEEWGLISPKTGKTVDFISARQLFEAIAESAKMSGDPGVLFLDTIERDSMIKYMGKLETTNPCGEVPLLPYESCCLGSINLHKFYNEINNTIEWEYLEQAVRVGIRFLDNAQDLSLAGLPIITRVSQSLRRLGLGVMGFADLCAELEIPYDSEVAYQLARKLSWFISFFSWSESMALAEERGTFPAFDLDKVDQVHLTRLFTDNFSPLSDNVKEDLVNDEVKFQVRNTAVTSIAPTGSIALLAGVNSSIEPFYSLAYKRNITEGGGEATSVIEVNKILLRKLEQHGVDLGKFVNEVFPFRPGVSDELQQLLPDKLVEVFKTAHDIHWRDHIRIQSAWQEFTSNAVSKTINLPQDSTVEDVKEAFQMMWEQDLKGGTIYVDGSKSFQILVK